MDSVTEPEALPQYNNVSGLDEVQGEWELDELVDDLHKVWHKQSTFLRLLQLMIVKQKGTDNM